MKKETVLCFCAHNDDHVIGAGGALAKFAKEGMRVRTVVFSYGEGSHPHLRPEVIKRRRKEEAVLSDKVLNGSGVVFFDLKDGHLRSELSSAAIKRRLVVILGRERPVMVFTHSFDDAHPDHRAVHDFVLGLADERKISCPVYSFDVWSLVRFKRRDEPRMVVDVSSTFKSKIKAFLVQRSQVVAIGALLWKMIVKDWLNGLFHGCRFAEVFYRIR